MYLLSCKGDMIAIQENNCYIKFVQQLPEKTFEIPFAIYIIWR